MKKKIFISGKITGEPIMRCIHKFQGAEYNLMEMFRHNFDPEIINPLKLDGIHFGIDHDKAILICYRVLKDCDAIFMLRDWKGSEGAKLEHQQAERWGIEIIYQKKM